MPPSTLRTQFARARLAAGRPDLHLHTLRATAISEAVHQGAEPKEWIGYNVLDSPMRDE